MKTTNEIIPTLSQLKATAKHHRKMEAAYRASNQTDNAESARKAAEMLEAQVTKMESNETA